MNNNNKLKYHENKIIDVSKKTEITYYLYTYQLT